MEKKKDDQSEWISLPIEKRDEVQATQAVVTLDTSALTEAAGTAGEPLANQLLRRPFGEDLVIQLSPHLPAIPWLSLASLRPAAEKESVIEEFQEQAETSHLFHMDLRIRLTDDYAAWWIESHNTLYSQHLSPIYRNRVAFKASLPQPEIEQTENPALWLADNRRHLSTALEQSLIEIARMTAYDLHQTEKEDTEYRTERGITGPLITEGETRVWLRDEAGNLLSLLKED